MIFGKVLDDLGLVKHLTYKIQKGDTPESVADKLKITLYELRVYHNFNCINDKDVINSYFPNHLEFLLVKPQIIESSNKEVEIKPIKVIFEEEFRIPFHYVVGKNSYNVFLSIENETKLQTVNYKVSVEFLKKDKNGYSLFEINRAPKVYVNNNITDKITDTLAEEVSTILYPLLIVVDQQGEWVDVYNFNDIVDRWTEKRKEIAENKGGSAINKYFNAVDLILSNSDNLLKNILDDWFLKLFFNGIHTSYTSNLSFTNQADFAITPKENPVKFNVTQKIHEHLNDANMIVIEKEGTLADLSQQTTFRNSTYSGNYHSIYHLNPNSYVVENASLECNILGDCNKKASVKIYNLNDRKIIASDQTKSFFVGETVKKGSFFKDLFKLHY